MCAVVRKDPAKLARARELLQANEEVKAVTSKNDKTMLAEARPQGTGCERTLTRSDAV